MTLFSSLTKIIARQSSIARADILDTIEDALLQADCGIHATDAVLSKLRRSHGKTADIRTTLHAILSEQLVGAYADTPAITSGDIVLCVGINGVGKTTTIAKLAHLTMQAQQSVQLVAADTFRAAAQTQLVAWGEKIDCPVYTGTSEQNGASVLFDALTHKKIHDTLLVDTAGRLHNNTDLMRELGKYTRLCHKHAPTAHIRTLLVLDANTGQNACVQAQTFSQHMTLDGILLTKLDGNDKGGIALSIATELDVPIRYICFGEKIDDIAPFSPTQFTDMLLSGMWNTATHTTAT